jgi:hypothetical protein
MKRIRAEVGRLFGNKYVWTTDYFNGKIRLHRVRYNTNVEDLNIGLPSWCYVYDYSRIGKFYLLSDGQTASGIIRKTPGTHYCEHWLDYEEYRHKKSLT